MSANDNSGVLCAGRVYCDVIFTGLSKLPVLGEEQFASSVSLHAGGGAYITAAYLAALDRSVSLMATLPGGPFSSFIQEQINQSRINAAHSAAALAGDDPQLTVAIAMEGERAFLTRRSGHALPVDNIDWLQMPDITHLHVGELATLVEHPLLVADAHAAGVTVSVDCGWDDSIFQRSDITDLLRNVDVFLPNQAEYNKLISGGFSANSVSLCVIKQGQSGAIAHHNGRSYASPARSVEVLDTTGAGDAFNAGFIHGWLQQKSVENCLGLGNTCGAKAVASIGGAVDLNAWGSMD